MSSEICRKGFLGMMAAAALPSAGWANSQDSVFRRRGRHERLNLSFARVDIGLKRPFSVLHVSDTHLTAAYPDEPVEILNLRDSRTQTFGGLQEEALADTIDWARKNVDFVIHTGDLIDWYSRANFDLVRKYFGSGLSSAMALGNHEYEAVSDFATKTDQEKKKSELAPQVKSAYPIDLKLQSTVVNGVNFVTLDNGFGTVTEEQVVRFREEVAKGLPIVLAMHVPVMTENVRLAVWHYWLRNGSRSDVTPGEIAVAPAYACKEVDPCTAAFIRDLRAERLLKCILAGHLHVTLEDRFSPTAVQYLVGGNFLFTAREVVFV